MMMVMIPSHLHETPVGQASQICLAQKVSMDKFLPLLDDSNYKVNITPEVAFACLTFHILFTKTCPCSSCCGFAGFRHAGLYPSFNWWVGLQPFILIILRPVVLLSPFCFTFPFSPFPNLAHLDIILLRSRGIVWIRPKTLLDYALSPA